MKTIAILLVGVALAALGGSVPAAAKVTPVKVEYGGPGGNASEYFELYHGGPAAVLLLHENGQSWKSVARIAEQLQKSEAGFTVLAFEWHKVVEKYGLETVWPELTAQVKRGIGYIREHAETLGIDSQRLVMVGGSRGANLSMLTALKANLAEPGTIKAVVSLSGDANVPAQIARNRELIEEGKEPNKKATNKISKTYGCQKQLNGCPPAYVAEWSPYQLVTPPPAGETAPAMMLMASHEEKTTANWEDQQPMAEALEANGVPAGYFLPTSGHGFAYWGGEARTLAIEFLQAHDGGT